MRRPLPRDPARFLHSRLLMAVHATRARWWRTKLVAPGGPVVSLTSFGARIGSVHLAIASIGRGSVRPSRLQLWLDDAELVASPPPALARLVRRGLEIRHCDDLGPHKKYLPYARSISEHTVPMVTADDDVLYPRRWLETLVADHLRHPDTILAHRVNRITVRDGTIAPYVEWGRATDLRDTPRNYAVGVKGVLFPPMMLDALRERGDAFLAVAPRSSDTWLHHVSLREGVSTLPCLALDGRGFVPIRGGARSPALMDVNVDRGRNDRVRAALLGRDEVRAVVDDRHDPSPSS